MQARATLLAIVLSLALSQVVVRPTPSYASAAEAGSSTSQPSDAPQTPVAPNPTPVPEPLVLPAVQKIREAANRMK
jgi:hypothetical protein